MNDYSKSGNFSSLNAEDDGEGFAVEPFVEVLDDARTEILEACLSGTGARSSLPAASVHAFEASPLVDKEASEHARRSDHQRRCTLSGVDAAKGKMPNVGDPLSLRHAGGEIAFEKYSSLRGTPAAQVQETVDTTCSAAMMALHEDPRGVEALPAAAGTDSAPHHDDSVHQDGIVSSSLDIKRTPANDNANDSESSTAASAPLLFVSSDGQSGNAVVDANTTAIATATATAAPASVTQGNSTRSTGPNYYNSVINDLHANQHATTATAVPAFTQGEFATDEHQGVTLEKNDDLSTGAAWSAGEHDDWKDYSCATSWEYFVNDIDNAIGEFETAAASSGTAAAALGTGDRSKGGGAQTLVRGSGARKKIKKQVLYNGRAYVVRMLYQPDGCKV